MFALSHHQAGKADDILSALSCPVFPLTSDSGNDLEKWLVIDSEDQQLVPSNEKSHPNKTAKLVHKEIDNDSGRGSCESPSLLLEKDKEAGDPLLDLKSPDTRELKESVTGKCVGEAPAIDLEGQFPLLSSGGPKASTWPGSQPTKTPFPKCSYHDIVDACKIALSAMHLNRSSILMGNKEQCNLECPKTISEGKIAMLQGAGKPPSDIQGDPGSPWSLPTERMPFLPTKAMDYVEVHKVNPNGALVVIPKQKGNVEKTESCPPAGDPKEYTKVSTVVANHILVLMPDPKSEALPSFQEPPIEPYWSCQPSLSEKNTSYCLPAPNACEVQTAELDYMDPNKFMRSFN